MLVPLRTVADCRGAVLDGGIEAMVTMKEPNMRREKGLLKGIEDAVGSISHDIASESAEKCDEATCDSLSRRRQAVDRPIEQI